MGLEHIHHQEYKHTLTSTSNHTDQYTPKHISWLQQSTQEEIEWPICELAKLWINAVETNETIEHEISAIFEKITWYDLFYKNIDIISAYEKKQIEESVWIQEISSELIEYLLWEYYLWNILTKPHIHDRFSVLKACFEYKRKDNIASIEFDVHRYIILHNQDKLHRSIPFPDDQKKLLKPKNIPWNKLITKPDFRASANFWQHEYKKNVPKYDNFDEKYILEEVFGWNIPDEKEVCLSKILAYMSDLKYDWMSFFYFNNFSFLYFDMQTDSLVPVKYENIYFDEQLETVFFEYIDAIEWIWSDKKREWNESVVSYLYKIQTKRKNVLADLPNMMWSEEHRQLLKLSEWFSARMEQYLWSYYNERDLPFDWWDVFEFIDWWVWVCRNYSVVFNNIYETARALSRKWNMKLYNDSKSCTVLEDGHVSNVIFERKDWKLQKSYIDITSYILFGNLHRIWVDAAYSILLAWNDSNTEKTNKNI